MEFCHCLCAVWHEHQCNGVATTIVTLTVGGEHIKVSTCTPCAQAMRRGRADDGTLTAEAAGYIPGRES